MSQVVGVGAPPNNARSCHVNAAGLAPKTPQFLDKDEMVALATPSMVRCHGAFGGETGRGRDTVAMTATTTSCAIGE